MMSVDLGIDLGTASVLVYVKGKGVVLKEPSVVAFDRDTNVIKAIGEEARLMLGRTPGNIIAVRPLRQGVISDYTVTEKMIKYFVQKALGKRTFKKPRISICVPSGVTEVEKKAVEEATFAAGAREVHLIEEPVAAAIGAGIDISKPCGNMIVDIGGGTADIAVISLGGTVVNTSIKIAGDDFDEALVRYMRKKHNLLIGERTAEDIKIKIGTCFPLAQADTMEMKKFYEGIYPNFDAGLFEKIREAFPSIDTKQTIRRLSKGMQKQVAFWLAISARPQILILDEPVDGLDPVMRRQIWSLILQDVTEHGTTVLVSSHNLRELEDVCDHVGIMNHGKIIIERSLSELQSSICKIQAAFQSEMPKLPKDLEVLHMSTTGRVHTMIVRGEPKQIKEQFTALNPMLMDVLPLSLEEIFIYELGGADYAVRDILF